MRFWLNARRPTDVPIVSTPEQIAPMTSTSVPINVEREVRFAVVMYGGVSLAIYINGVTQELLNMVRATAPKTVDPSSPDFGTALLGADHPELPGTAGVYRRLGQYLADRAKLQQAASPGPDGKRRPPTADEVTTRFIVDVISGTSAGGINGVFLGKALARNQKMDGLKKLWLTEGDLGKLLNDTKAEDYSDNRGFAVQRPEKSLLNSQRMYRKLLEALEDMGASAVDSGEPSPLVNEFDLFITTTDIEGIPLPIKLADGVVYERRYRNVFHFRYAPDPRSKEQRKKDGEDFSRDDFKKNDDPFLAFAARCTSSFPFAFDAMQLGDIGPVLERYQRYESDDPWASNDPRERARWDHFFKEYLRLGLFDIDKKARAEQATGLPAAGNTTEQTIDSAFADLRNAFRNRSFGDGGYLDNKPFSYATSMLARRWADCVVDRKLIYVEPTPEHPELTPRKPRQRPDFAANVRAAALDLPRQETIREDLERLYQRNATLERIATFASHVDEDAIRVRQKKPLTHEQFGEADLGRMIDIYGVSFGAYHRLKVEEITGFISDLIVAALGHDPDSDAAAVIREFVIQWRRENYVETKPDSASAGNQGLATENQFLLDFDLRYTFRRLSFLNQRINQLAQTVTEELDEKAENLLSVWLKHLESPSVDKSKTRQDRAEAAQRLRVQLESPGRASAAVGKWAGEFREELRRVKKEKIAGALVSARLAEEAFLTPGSKPAADLQEAASDFDLSWETMQQILAEEDDDKRKEIFDSAFRQHREKLKKLADVIKNTLSKRDFARLTIADPADVDLSKGDVAARVFLDHYYQNFVLYDLITYPVRYGTGVGEANTVEVYRVSPEDAPSIIDERRTGEKRSKLAGRAVMSFGAFLDQRWRKNDMLWGRLDGAERLISILLPDDKDEKVRRQLTEQAHISILEDEVTSDDLDQIAGVISQALANSAPGSDQARVLREFVETLLQSKELSVTMSSALRQCLQEPGQLLAYYRSKYEVDRQLDSEKTLQLISRATTITGGMLDGLADQYRSNPGKRVAAWIAMLGTTFWNLVAVAVPQSLRNLFFQHWLGLLYVFAFLTIFVGLFVNDRVKVAGWEVLGIVVALNLVVSGLSDFMAGRGRLLSSVKGIIIIVLTTLIVLGAYCCWLFFSSLSPSSQRNWLAAIASALVVMIVGPAVIGRVARWISSKR